ncbi:MAG: DUF2059 domain-containing protein [Deltaproteobacteria bacterium]|nr:DUF2059 domain-containing protein [Deltaproteobacteria bacterium]
MNRGHMMKKLGWIAVASVLACQVAPEKGSELSPAMRKKLFEVYELMDINSGINAMMDSMAAQVPKEMVDCFRKAIDFKAQMDKSVEVLARILTGDEINAMHKFYTSKLGRAMMKKMPIAMKEVGEQMRTFIQTEIPKVMQQCAPKQPDAPPAPAPSND